MEINEMNGQELYAYRTKLYRQAHTFQKPERVLLNPFLYGWMYHDCGYKVAEAARDYKVCEEVMAKMAERYKIDALNIGNSGFRFRLRLYDALGGSNNFSAASGEDNLNAIYEDVLSADDYDAMIENLNKILWEKALFEMYPKAREYTPQQMADAAKEMWLLNKTKREADERIRNKYGLLIEKDFLSYGLFFDKLSNSYRGIKGISMDLRRRPEKVYELCEYWDDKTATALEKKTAASEYGWGDSNYYDYLVTMLGHNILNMKQLERLYLKPLKRVLDAIEKKGKLVFILIEGAFERFGDFLNDYPKGFLNVSVEQDDIYTIRRKFPNLALTGGLNVDVMGHGTPEECVAMAKKAIDELGTDGGLYLMPNKMVSYSYDMTSENLKAVGEFVSNYRIN